MSVSSMYAAALALVGLVIGTLNGQPVLAIVSGAVVLIALARAVGLIPDGVLGWGIPGIGMPLQLAVLTVGLVLLLVAGVIGWMTMGLGTQAILVILIVCAGYLSALGYICGVHRPGDLPKSSSDPNSNP